VSSLSKITYHLDIYLVWIWHKS